MSLNVAYGGGCDVHEFRACWDHSFAEQEGRLVAAIRVGHDAHQDTCEADISESVEIDLEEIAAGWRLETGLDAGTLLVQVTLFNWPTVDPPSEEQTIEWTLD